MMKRKILALMLIVFLPFCISCEENSDDDQLIVIPDEIAQDAYYLFYDLNENDIYPELEKIEVIHEYLFLARQVDDRLAGIHAICNHSYILGEIFVLVDENVITNVDTANIRFNNSELDAILNQYNAIQMSRENWHTDDEFYFVDFELEYNPMVLSALFEGKTGVIHADPNGFVFIPEHIEGITIEIIDNDIYRFEFKRVFINQPSENDGVWVVDVQDGNATLVSYTSGG